MGAGRDGGTAHDLPQRNNVQGRGDRLMPYDKSRYPKNWKAIALKVKEDANWTCQHCGRPCRKPGVDWEDFVGWLGLNYPNDWYHETSDYVADDDTGEWGFVERPQRFTLTVAHLDHDPGNPNARLAALCSGCHLRYDAPSKAARRKEKPVKGQLQLF